MFALAHIAVNSNSTDVFIAIIGFCGLLLTAVITATTQLYMRKHLGHKNGQGNVTEMLELVLRHQAEHEVRDDLRFAQLGVDPDKL